MSARKRTPSKLPPQSYREIDPLEQGGRTARDGFDYQDHLAVNKCLDMMLGSGPSEVWCEAEDDIVLLWSEDGKERFEFVQVKSDDLKQAWTVAKFCAPSSGNSARAKRSIFEKLLEHDRGRELCSFRMITKWEPDADLSLLKLAATDRSPDEKKKLATKIVAKVGDKKSPNDNGVDFWVEHATWECRATTDDVRNDNLIKLERLLDSQGRWLAPDQREELHAALLRRVQDASLANGKTQKQSKRLCREELRDWLLSRAERIVHPTHSGSPAPLEQKLIDAGVAAESVSAAKEQRRKYLQEARQPRYLSVDDRELFESAALARLHRLKSRLDAGELPDDSRQFLSRCQSELNALRCGSEVSETFSYGYMYDVMNRCMHRLQRVST